MILVAPTPTSAPKRNPHSSKPVARGFLPRGLSYASRRPKLFTFPDGPLIAGRIEKADLTCEHKAHFPAEGKGLTSNLLHHIRIGNEVPIVQKETGSFGCQFR